MKHNKLLKWGLVALAVLTMLCSITMIGFAQESEPTAPTLSIKTFNLSLENAVFMNFKVGSENVSNPANIKLLAWNQAPAEYKKGTEDACLSSRGTEAGTGYEIFQYNDLAAKDMTKMVYVCAYVNENGVEAYSAPAKFSIAMYAYLKKNAANPDTDLCKLLDAMLSYGAASQIYFNHNTNLLATDTLHQITVKNGTLPDGFAKGWYKNGTTVTLTANAPEVGFAFSHWTNSAGEEVSIEAAITVDVTKADTYTANYEKAVVYSQGLEFTSNGDGTCYVSGIGTCTDTDINIPPVSPEGWTVTGVGDWAFSKNNTITGVTIPESVITIENWAFGNCTNLLSITFAETPQLSNIDISAFYGCTNLTAIYIPKSVTNIGTNAFYGCANLTKITVETGNTKYHSKGNCLIETARKTLVAGCNTSVIPTDGSIVYIADSAFYACNNLTSIIIPDSVTYISDSAFYACSNLASVTISNNVTHIGDGAFRDCISLINFTIPENVTTISDHAFCGCINLTNVTFPENSELTSIDKYAFYGCTSLTSITIPYGVTSIGEAAFYDCSSLTNVTFAENSKLTDIGNYAFQFCSSLTGVTFAENSKLTGIGVQAFYNCKNLASINIPDSVTKIGSSAFFDCTLLELTIPESVTFIGSNAVKSCKKIIWENENSSKWQLKIASIIAEEPVEGGIGKTLTNLTLTVTFYNWTADGYLRNTRTIDSGVDYNVAGDQYLITLCYGSYDLTRVS